MTTLEVILLITTMLSSTVALLGTFFSIKFGLLILRMEDSLEECLDILDTRYESISKVLEIPIWSDSAEIRRVVQDIHSSRSAILQIANIMTKDGIQQAPEEVDQDGNEA